MFIWVTDFSCLGSLIQFTKVVKMVSKANRTNNARQVSPNCTEELSSNAIPLFLELLLLISLALRLFKMDN